ncbi:MAG: uroporphyrinogen-III C-methyltransferase [Thermoleophilaceae bacterium]
MADGVVYLVGAGPGDPGLMTRRSLELIAEADAILYDRLIPAAALDGAREDCDLIYVGKAPGDVAMSQEGIDQRLVDLGRAGKRVVRLKGGDPFVFGRGGEEAEALRGAGVDFEVVPGVTSGVAAPAYAGIPVTHRDAASAVAFVTGHEDPEKADSALDWKALARFPGTLVLYMGVKNLPLIAGRLTAAGRDPAEPAAVIAQGTLPTAANGHGHARRHSRAGRRGGHPRPGHHRDRTRGRTARRRWPGWSAVRCTDAASP